MDHYNNVFALLFRCYIKELIIYSTPHSFIALIKSHSCVILFIYANLSTGILATANCQCCRNTLTDRSLKMWHMVGILADIQHNEYYVTACDTDWGEEWYVHAQEKTMERSSACTCKLSISFDFQNKECCACTFRLMGVYSILFPWQIFSLCCLYYLVKQYFIFIRQVKFRVRFCSEWGL